MPQYDITKIWDGTAAQLFDGADPGTDLGFNAEVTIALEEQYIDVTAAQTGATVLDRRLLDQRYRVTIDFTEVGQANYFADWWHSGHPSGKLHKGALGGSVPSKRLRIHPSIMAADTTKDWVFERLVRDRGPSMTMNGQNRLVHRFEFITLPVAATLPTVDVGQLGYTAP